MIGTELTFYNTCRVTRHFYLIQSLQGNSTGFTTGFPMDGIHQQVCLSLYDVPGRQPTRRILMRAFSGPKSRPAAVAEQTGRLTWILFVMFDEGYSRRRNKLTSSIAAIAASDPLLPALVPDRSIACSMVSVVSTPNTTGKSSSRETLAMPLAH